MGSSRQGGSAGSGMNTMVTGVVAASENATLSRSDVRSGREGVRVSKVTMPADGWIVVRSARPPYSVLGTEAVPAGTSRDVTVRLRAADGLNAFVALHVDRGVRGVFEFDPSSARRNPDAEVFVDGAPVEIPLRIHDFGVDVAANTALVMVKDQPAKPDSVRVEYVYLPESSWLVVSRLVDGLPGESIGAVLRPRGEFQGVEIPLEEPVTAGERLRLTVHADRGVGGRFEYDPSDPLALPDQPYIGAGVIVSQDFTVR